MRRSEGHRHPVFEWIVFALALLLAGVLALHGARRFLSRRPAPSGIPMVSPPLGPVDLEPAASGSRTETAVSALPPVRLSSMGGGQKRWKTEVPAPPSSSKK